MQHAEKKCMQDIAAQVSLSLSLSLSLLLSVSLSISISLSPFLSHSLSLSLSLSLTHTHTYTHTPRGAFSIMQHAARKCMQDIAAQVSLSLSLTVTHTHTNKHVHTSLVGPGGFEWPLLRSDSRCPNLPPWILNPRPQSLKLKP